MELQLGVREGSRQKRCSSALAKSRATARARQASLAGTPLPTRRRSCQPIRPNPSSMVAQVPGSGTAEGTSTGCFGSDPGNVAGGDPPPGELPGPEPGRTIALSVGGATPSSGTGCGSWRSTAAGSNTGAWSSGATWDISIFGAAAPWMFGRGADRVRASARACLVLVSSPPLLAPGERAPMRSARL